MYVDALSEGSRTRVRFPPPPPFLKREALDVQGLFLFGVIEITDSRRIPAICLWRADLSCEDHGLIVPTLFKRHGEFFRKKLVCSNVAHFKP